MRKKILEKLRARTRNERGASTTIEFLGVILILFIFTISIIDLGIYFNDRNIVTDAAQNGARLTSIYGGSGNTPIATAYGETDMTSDCNAVHANGPAACGMVQQMQGAASSTIDLQIKSATCYVNSPGEDDRKADVETLQDRPTCSITWEYDGIPGSAITLFSTLRNQKKVQSTVTETANAEVIENGDK